MIFFPHILDGFGSPLVTEVDVEIGHRDAVRVQEPLKEEIVLERIDIRDTDRVGDYACSAAAAPGPYRYPLCFGPLNKVHDDEIIFRKAHAEDDAQFIIGAFFYGLRYFPVAALQPVPCQLRQIVFRVGAVLGRISRDQRLILDWVAVVFQVKAGLFRTFLRDDERIFDRFGNIGKQFRHLLRRFQVKLVRPEFHPLRIVDRLLRLDTEQNVLHFPVLFPQIMHVVRRHGRNIQFL